MRKIKRKRPEPDFKSVRAVAGKLYTIGYDNRLQKRVVRVDGVIAGEKAFIFSKRRGGSPRSAKVVSSTVVFTDPALALKALKPIDGYVVRYGDEYKVIPAKIVVGDSGRLEATDPDGKHLYGNPFKTKKEAFSYAIKEIRGEQKESSKRLATANKRLRELRAQSARAR